jgi:5-(carboxyamino)imidazole ribonucleotide synthase
VAESYARKVLDRLGYVGVLAIELFQVGDGLYANEMAPRVHNSGHWTIDGAETGQFENHVRAIVGAPLGSTRARGAAAMVNLIGDVPDPSVLLAIPGAKVHLYGKAPKPGRKVGHVTVVGESQATIAAAVAAVRALAGDR